MKCMCGSTNPGRTVAPLTSTISVFGPRDVITSVFEPMAENRPPVTATASATGRRGDIVRNRPLIRMTSAGSPAAMAGRTAEAATSPPIMLTNAPRLMFVTERNTSRYGGRHVHEPTWPVCFTELRHWTGPEAGLLGGGNEGAP